MIRFDKLSDFSDNERIEVLQFRYMNAFVLHNACYNGPHYFNSDTDIKDLITGEVYGIHYHETFTLVSYETKIALFDKSDNRMFLTESYDCSPTTRRQLSEFFKVCGVVQDTPYKDKWPNASITWIRNEVKNPTSDQIVLGDF